MCGVFSTLTYAEKSGTDGAGDLRDASFSILSEWLGNKWRDEGKRAEVESLWLNLVACLAFSARGWRMPIDVVQEAISVSETKDQNDIRPN